MPLSPSSSSSSNSNMASSMIPHHYLYSNYTFTTNSDHLHQHHLAAEFPTTQQGMMDNINSTIMWGASQDGLLTPILDDDNSNSNNGALDHIVSSVLDCDVMYSSAAWMPNSAGFSNSDINQQLDHLVMPISDSCSKMGFLGGGGGNINAAAGLNIHHQNFNSRGSYLQLPALMQGDQFGDECCGGFVEDVKPPPPAPYPNTTTATSQNWGTIQGNQIAAVEEPNIKVGRYSEEERKERILRYLKKRNQRNFNKTIKYACRKTLADRRVRVRGRFARNNELCDQEDNMATKKHENLHIHHNDDFYGADSFQFQLKNEEEDWLQEAMASLVYLSHSSPEDM